MARFAHLVSRYGVSVVEPTADRLRAALAELFDGPPDAEHPNVWLTVGDDEAGPCCTLDVYRSGTALFTVAADQDADPHEEFRRDGLTAAEAFDRMGRMLACEPATAADLGQSL